MKLIEQLAHQLDTTTDVLIGQLTTREALSIPFLPERVRQSMLLEAQQLPYTKLEVIVANGKVQQDIYRADLTFSSGYIGWVAKKTKALIEGVFSGVEPPLFAEPLVLNEVSVQRYPIGGGISPHVDGKKFLNLVVLVVIEGHGELYTCTDRSGAHATCVPCPPGQLVILPARGYRDRTDTPFHYLGNVTAERYLLGLRQNIRLT